MLFTSTQSSNFLLFLFFSLAVLEEHFNFIIIIFLGFRKSWLILLFWVSHRFILVLTKLNELWVGGNGSSSAVVPNLVPLKVLHISLDIVVEVHFSYKSSQNIIEIYVNRTTFTWTFFLWKLMNWNVLMRQKKESLCITCLSTIQ